MSKRNHNIKTFKRKRVKPRVYRHYGSSTFDPELLRSESKIRYFLDNKPGFGLWSSPIDTDFGWYDWCVSEDFHTETLNEYFDFKLRPDANIYIINCEEDCQNLAIRFPLRSSDPYKLFANRCNAVFDSDPNKIFANRYNAVFDNGIDFVAVSKEYDGIEVNVFGGHDYAALRFILNTWDVDSLVVWNPDVVEVI